MSKFSPDRILHLPPAPVTRRDELPDLPAVEDNHSQVITPSKKAFAWPGDDIEGLRAEDVD